MNWQDVILVNMLGKRFYDETSGGFTANDCQLSGGVWDEGTSTCSL
jgi:hypothetical protein